MINGWLEWLVRGSDSGHVDNNGGRGGVGHRHLMTPNAAFCDGLLDGDGQYEGFCLDGRIGSCKLYGICNKNEAPGPDKLRGRISSESGRISSESGRISSGKWPDKLRGWPDKLRQVAG